MGYKNFYYEMPTNLFLEEVRFKFEEYTQTTAKIIDRFPTAIEEFCEHMQSDNILKILGPEYFYSRANTYLDTKLINTKDKIEFTIFAYIASFNNLCKETIGNDITPELMKIMLDEIYNKEFQNDILNPAVATLSLIDAIINEQLQYQCIDDPSFNLDHFKLDSTALRGRFEREINNLNLYKHDRIMATAYLQAAGPVFGLNRLKHVAGLQELIHKWIPPEIACANFDFIYIYRENANEEHDPYSKEAWNSYRQKNTPLPLGLTLIDGFDNNDDEVAELVRQHIHKRIMQFKSLPDYLKEIPDISFSGQVRKQVNNVFNFFSQAIDDIRAAAIGNISEQDTVVMKKWM